MGSRAKLSPDFAREDGVHLPSLLAALAGEPYKVGKAEGLRLLKAGADAQAARGILYGGCLSILLALLGTAFEPQTEGKLLFLEDVGVKPYQIDRMLWQLKQSEKLDGVKGLREALLRYSPQFVRVIAEKLTIYALGRGTEYYDMPLIRSIVHDAEKNNYRFSSLVLGVVKSEQFQMNQKLMSGNTPQNQQRASR